MSALSIKQIIEQARSSAPSMVAIADNTSAAIELKFHGADARPEDVATSLREALPTWTHALAWHADSCAWASIIHGRAEITIFVTDKQAAAFISRRESNLQ